ncbi:hypothetical protein ACW4FQ_32110, partial [Escherichia coli]
LLLLQNLEQTVTAFVRRQLELLFEIAAVHYLQHRQASSHEFQYANQLFVFALGGCLLQDSLCFLGHGRDGSLDQVLLEIQQQLVGLFCCV